MKPDLRTTALATALAIALLPVLAVAAFLAGCEGPCQKIDTISGPSLTSGTADFSTVAAIGTNFSAGFQSGGLVDTLGT